MRDGVTDSRQAALEPLAHADLQPVRRTARYCEAPAPHLAISGFTAPYDLTMDIGRL